MAKKEGSAAKRIGNQLVIPANLSDGELWKTMQPHDDIEVSHPSSLPRGA